MNLCDALQANRIKSPLIANTKAEVIRELLALINESGITLDGETVLQAVLDREKVMTTGVGNGVAIPHCKINTIDHFVVAMGIHPEGIDFQSLDQKPARVIFLLVGPDQQPGGHIRLLSRISRIISNEKIRNQILEDPSIEATFSLLQSAEADSFDLHT